MDKFQKDEYEKIISRCSLLSAIATCNPLPGGDTLLIILIQLWMLNQIGRVKRVPSRNINTIEMLKKLASRRLGKYAVNELINVLPIGIPCANALLSYYITNKVGWEAAESMNEESLI